MAVSRQIQECRHERQPAGGIAREDLPQGVIAEPDPGPAGGCDQKKGQCRTNEWHRYQQAEGGIGGHGRVHGQLPDEVRQQAQHQTEEDASNLTEQFRWRLQDRQQERAQAQGHSCSDEDRRPVLADADVMVGH